jgi:hypothetical protein
LKFKNPRKNSNRQPLHEVFNSGVKGLSNKYYGIERSQTARKMMTWLSAGRHQERNTDTKKLNNKE